MIHAIEKFVNTIFKKAQKRGRGEREKREKKNAKGRENFLVFGSSRSLFRDFSCSSFRVFRVLLFLF
jgi:hypothetical protein